MERLREILEDVKCDIDFETEKALIDDRLLDSLDILTLVAELEEEYDIVIPPVEIVRENFNSEEAIAAMVKRLSE